MTNKHQFHSGFSLIQMAIVLTIIAILAASLLPGRGSNPGTQADLTSKRMTVIENALRGWRLANGHLPCPADGTLAITDDNFGIEAANAGSCTGGSPAANFGPSGNAVAGVVPVRTLNLADEYALDGFGRRFTYVVDKRATSGGSATPLPNFVTLTAYNSEGESIDPQVYVTSVAHGLTDGATITVSGAYPFQNVNDTDLNGTHTVTVLDADNFSYSAPYTGVGCPNSEYQSNDPGGDITMACPCWRWGTCDVGIQDLDLVITSGSGSNCTSAVGSAPYGITITGDTADSAMVAIISHGANGHGAFPAKGSSIANRINAGATDASELENASVDASFNQNFNATFVKKASTTTFDDIVVYGKYCE